MAARRLAHAHNPLSFLEVALVTAVLGIAAAVAVPEYFQLRADANDDSAKSRLVQASRDLTVGAAVPAGVYVHAAGAAYCLQTAVGGRVWHELQHAKPVQGACPKK
jgi:hypothetical protein